MSERRRKPAKRRRRSRPSSPGRVSPPWDIWDPGRPVIAQWSIWDALEDNPTLLLARLRGGIATPEETAFMADLYETAWRRDHPEEAARKNEMARGLEPGSKQQFYETEPRRLRHASPKVAGAKKRNGDPKRGDPKRFVNQAMAQMAFVMEAAGDAQKTIIDRVANTFGVSGRHVYNAKKEFAHTVLQVEQLRDANMNLQALQSWFEQLGAFDRTMSLGFIDQIAAARARSSRQET